MINKIVYIFSERFNSRDYKRFGIEIMQSNGFDVAVWELAEIDKIFNDYLNPDEIREDLPFLTRWTSRRDVVQALSLLKDDAVIIDLVTSESIWLYKAIQKNHIKTIRVLPSGYFVEHSRRSSLINRIKKIVRLSMRPRLFYRFIMDKKAISCGHFNSHDLLVVPGAKYRAPKNIDKIKILYAHALDYDLYLEEEEKGELSPSAPEYGVFLDQWLPFHPDFNASGVFSPVTPEKYYKTVTAFFSYLENMFGIPIKVAAHPRSFYHKSPYKEKNFFQGREICTGETYNIVKNSKFVLLHGSTSINYAILYEKPLIFFETDEMKGTAFQFWCENKADEFKETLINADKINELKLSKESLLSVNKTLYGNYKNNYIKVTGTPEVKLFQILADELKSGILL